MNLLDKFAAVEIKADNRISEADRTFCVRRQEAYNKANERLRELADLFHAMEADLVSILGSDDDYSYRFIHNGSVVSSPDAISTIHKNHRNFISGVTRYFADTYSVKLDADTIIEHLIPKAPKEPRYSYEFRRLSERTQEEAEEDRRKHSEYEESLEEYNNALTHLSICYEAIIDEIFTQLGGFSFTEQALNELKEKCYIASHRRYYWNKTDETEDFEIKKDTLQITGYGCHYDGSWSTPRWEIPESTKDILNGIAHYERGEFNYGCKLFPALFGWRNEQNFFDFPLLDKVRCVKLLKYGRVEFMLVCAAAVNEFVKNYLRVKVGGVA